MVNHQIVELGLDMPYPNLLKYVMLGWADWPNSTCLNVDQVFLTHAWLVNNVGWVRQVGSDFATPTTNDN